MERNIRSQKIVLIGVLAVGLLLINTCLSFRNIKEMHVDTRGLIHTHKAIETLANIASLITVAGARQQGYIFTGDLRYLESYNSIFSIILKQFNLLENFLQGNPEQLASVSLLRKIVVQRLKVLNGNFLLIKEKGLDAARNSIESGLDNMPVDGLGPQVKKMLGAENKLMEVQTRHLKDIYHVTLYTGLLTNFISFMMIGTFCCLLRLYLINRGKNMLETALRDSENRFRKLSDDLAKSNKELEQFAFIAAHDLKEPLVMIQSFADFLSRRASGKLDKKERDYLGSIKEATVQGQALIKDLLEFSRIGKEEKLQTMDLCKTIDIVRINLKMLIEESGASIEYDECLPHIKCLPMEMGQLFQNLIENAIKYRSSDPLKIHISAVETKNNMWLVAVRDNGAGIPSENTERIFNIFERGSTDSSGTGIGLAICRRVVENYGGKIWVESEVGRGSIFYFTLPKINNLK